MESNKVRKFLALSGQGVGQPFDPRDAKTRALGAQILLSEVLEYIVYGLGVTPSFNGQALTSPDGLSYEAGAKIDSQEMLDGICDVAYTMYWNALAFGLPVEEGFELVCNNNLEKFVALPEWNKGRGVLAQSDWHCGLDITWPAEVAVVEVVQIEHEYYAVGKDAKGKVRKPCHFRAVDLSGLLSSAV